MERKGRSLFLLCGRLRVSTVSENDLSYTTWVLRKKKVKFAFKFTYNILSVVVTSLVKIMSSIIGCRLKHTELTSVGKQMVNVLDVFCF